MEYCQTKCTGSGTRSCTATNVVPMVPPPLVRFRDEQNIPWGTGDCKRECFDAEELTEGWSMCCECCPTSCSVA